MNSNIRIIVYLAFVFFLVHKLASWISKPFVAAIRASSGYAGSKFDWHPEGPWIGWCLIINSFVIYMWYSVLTEPAATANIFGVDPAPISENAIAGMLIVSFLCVCLIRRTLIAVNRIAKNIMPSIINYDCSDHSCS